MSTGYTHITSGVNPYATLDYESPYFHEYVLEIFMAEAS